MNKCYLVVLMCCALLIGAGTSVAAGENFSDQNGKAVHLQDFKGKWVIFAYISPRCHFCKKQTPILNDMLAAYADKVAVLGVNHEQLDASELKSFHSMWDMHFPMLKEDPTDFLKIATVHAAPTMVLLDPEGKKMAPLVGVYTRAELEAIMFKKH